MKHFLSTAFGTATGTLIYTGLLSSAQQPEWGRALAVGIVCGLGSLAWPRKKKTA